jgi:hypothetical protein
MGGEDSEGEVVIGTTVIIKLVGLVHFTCCVQFMCELPANRFVTFVYID